MNKFLLMAVISGLFIVFACNKDEPSERFIFLTTPIWVSDSLLVNGMDASGEGQALANFKGEAKFNKDGTGYLGSYEAKWRFGRNETEIWILDTELAPTIITSIVELNQVSLKITTDYPGLGHVRFTFRAK